MNKNQTSSPPVAGVGTTLFNILPPGKVQLGVKIMANPSSSPNSNPRRVCGLSLVECIPSLPHLFCQANTLLGYTGGNKRWVANFHSRLFPHPPVVAALPPPHNEEVMI